MSVPTMSSVHLTRAASWLFLALLCAAFLAGSQRVQSNDPAWTGTGSCRILVRVDPVNLEGRTKDDLVARCPINFAEILGRIKIRGEADLSTIQVHKYDPKTGAAQPFRSFENALSSFDRPCRFDDESIPWDYPDRATYASDYPSGRGPVVIRKGGGRLFNREKDNNAGHVTWVHTQSGDEPSFYAIYWDVRPSKDQTGPSPAPWIGDVDVLRRK